MFNFLKGFYKEDLESIKDQLREEPVYRKIPIKPCGYVFYTSI